VSLSRCFCCCAISLRCSRCLVFPVLFASHSAVPCCSRQDSAQAEPLNLAARAAGPLTAVYGRRRAACGHHRPARARARGMVL
jgi:hypothetical protein